MVIIGRFSNRRSWRGIAALLALCLASSGLAQAATDAMSLYVKRDYVAALRGFHQQARLGDEVAKYNLGIMYEQGQGTPQDYAEAVKWYLEAAHAGVVNAQLNLGSMYEKGQGVAQDYVAAASWYDVAATQGLPTAQLNLGLLYGQGRGVKQDYVQAHMWFALAASRTSNAQERARAMQVSEIVAAEMTPEQIAEARKRARAWKPRRARP
jgi:TPR repeat protein